MKKIIGTYLLATVLVLNAGVALAAANNLRLHGALVAEPCVIAPGDEEIALDFGTIIDKYLYLNTRTLGQTFEIHLAECDISLGKTVAITLLGTESLALPGLLAINADSQAKGIAIGLETPEGKALPMNKTSDKYSLRAGGNSVALQAYVRGEPQAIERKTIGRGAFGAVATFRLEYE
ncbi:TPA: type 1 fimbrial protein [Serratia marcescens]|uniref:fimbrial protein n=1 Tax=Serratia TaxID=613 RepID=UPI0018D7A62F|nr:type 1 fimbrial protein [Serratia marcescens]HAT2868626.1 type 1 fimbrial protein [Serratia marcescens]HAT2873858.1 type 1 fimbrial protein [Serratia marcescens]HAT2924512.1 type 1 fimbrial protein [Serratia marcescens]